MNKTLDQLVGDIIAWQRATFLDGTEEGRIAHFREEIDEYLADPRSGEEAADLFMLFVAVFSQHSINLHYEVERKLKINMQRQWAKAPGGYSKHVPEPDVRQVESMWTSEADQYLLRERLLGSSVWSIASTLKCSEDEVWDRINLIIARETSGPQPTARSPQPDVTPDIDWDNVPSGLHYAWLVLNYRCTGLVWCASRTKPVRTNNGFNAPAVTIWNNGSTDVQVREGVDFRTIFRQRPGGSNE